MPYISIETLSAFALTSLVIKLTPGPNMAYLAVLSLGHGRPAGLAATLGIALGLLIVGVAAALGLAAVISSSVLLYEALRWAGFAYLLWLAWLGWQGEAETSPGRPQIEEANTAFFSRGLITNLLNPKAAIFYVAVVPSFVEPGSRVLGQDCDFVDGLCVHRYGDPRHDNIARRHGAAVPCRSRSHALREAHSIGRPRRHRRVVHDQHCAGGGLGRSGPAKVRSVLPICSPRLRS